jgi:hypothetical protein
VEPDQNHIKQAQRRLRQKNETYCKQRGHSLTKALAPEDRLNAFPMLALINQIGTYHAVIDECIAAHVRPITSGNKIYRNGLTAPQEMARLKRSCQSYLIARGTDWMQNKELRTIFES